MSLTRAAERAVKLALDLIALSGAFGLAFLLRFEGSLPPSSVAELLAALPVVLAAQLLGLTVFGVRRLCWRHVSLREAQRVALALLAASALLLGLWVGAAWGLPWPERLFGGPLPLGVLLLDLPLSVLGVVGVRAAARRWSEGRQRRGQPPAEACVPTVLVGADFAAAAVARELSARPELGVRLLGLVDEDGRKRGMLIGGVPVLGGLKDLPELARAEGAEQVLITPRAPESVRRTADLCAGSGLAVKIVPDLGEVLRGRLGASTIREVRIEDLLRRPPVALDLEAVAANLRGRRVLVSGAGGSIGAEL
jgi:FlaA1/EpsC-like NDP-sugar epimerase